jgi:hypothetical protein
LPEERQKLLRRGQPYFFSNSREKLLRRFQKLRRKESTG